MTKVAPSNLTRDASSEVINELFVKGGLCYDDPVRDSGKRFQLVKILILVTTPVLVLLGLTCYFLFTSVTERNQLAEQKDKIFTGRDLGELIHVLQKERDQTALYLSAIGPDTKIYLLDRYSESNSALSKLKVWPVNLARDRKEHFQYKHYFSSFMSAHRNALDLVNPTVYDEILFYNDQIEVLIKWMYDAIRLSRFSDIWKLLVTYKKVVTSKEYAGVERALGSSYFANGGFESNSFYLWYLQKVNTFTYEYRTAELFSEDIRKMSVASSQHNASFRFVWEYRKKLSQNPQINVSVVEAKYYYDNMTLFIDELFRIQNKVVVDITDRLHQKEIESLKNIIVAAILMTLIVAFFPVQVLFLHSQTSDIQNYALVLVSKTQELKDEKQRTESLLYQMLPKGVAKQLKNSENVTGEYFSSATILFTEIYEFARITKQHSAVQVIGFLQETYSLIDQCIDQFDVYKVENIADQHMVVSGVPLKNNGKHATEVANMALELLSRFELMESTSIPEPTVAKVGIHSGSVMAGVVGLRLPKYSLFGDTVNTAARMETSGKGNCIHVSSATYKLLKQADKKGLQYSFHCRGKINVKGKGTMTTYWLYGKNVPFCMTESSLSEPSTSFGLEQKSQCQAPSLTPLYGWHLLRNSLEKLKTLSLASRVFHYTNVNMPLPYHDDFKNDGQELNCLITPNFSPKLLNKSSDNTTPQDEKEYDVVAKNNNCKTGNKKGKVGEHEKKGKKSRAMNKSDDDKKMNKVENSLFKQTDGTPLMKSMTEQNRNLVSKIDSPIMNPISTVAEHSNIPVDGNIQEMIYSSCLKEKGHSGSPVTELPECIVEPKEVIISRVCNEKQSPYSTDQTSKKCKKKRKPSAATKTRKRWKKIKTEFQSGDILENCFQLSFQNNVQEAAATDVDVDVHDGIQDTAHSFKNDDNDNIQEDSSNSPLVLATGTSISKDESEEIKLNVQSIDDKTFVNESDILFSCDPPYSRPISNASYVDKSDLEMDILLDYEIAERGDSGRNSIPVFPEDSSNPDNTELSDIVFNDNVEDNENNDYDSIINTFDIDC